MAWESGREVRLEPNRHYSGPAPLLEEIKVRFPVTTPDSWHELVANGTCDVVLPTPANQTAWQPWARLAAAGEVTMWADVAPTVLRLDMNPEPEPAPDQPPDAERTSPLQDPQVRQALAGCVSRQRLTQALPAEALAAASGFIPPNHPAYVERTTLAFNPQASGRLLDTLGWQDRDGDGVREAESVPGFVDGEPLRLTLHFVPSSSPWQHTLRGIWRAVVPTSATAGGRAPTLCRAAVQARSSEAGSSWPLLGWQATVPEICGGWLSSRIPTAENGWQGENREVRLGGL